MKIAKNIVIDAPIERVWGILALQYVQVYQWARAVHSSTEFNAPNSPVASPVSGRVCEASIGAVQETITVFDEENYHLKYRAKAQAMPFFVRALYGNWVLSEIGDKTSVALSFEPDLMQPFSLLMGWMIKRQFLGAIEDTLEDLQIYAETGRVHPEKAAQLKVP